MTGRPDKEVITELLHASSDDEETLPLPIPDRIFGFHAQQAVEKLLKALIVATGQMHEYTHDIEVLVLTAVNRGEAVPATPFPLADLTDFGVMFRYTVPRTIGEEERRQIRESVHILRQHVHARVVVLRL